MNVQKRKREQEQEVKESKKSEKSQEPKQEHEWKRESAIEPNTKHNEAHAAGGDQNRASKEWEKPLVNGHKEEKETEYQRLLKKCSPQEIALLGSLQHENDYIKNLK